MQDALLLCYSSGPGISNQLSLPLLELSFGNLLYFRGSNREELVYIICPDWSHDTPIFSKIHPQYDANKD